MPATEIAATRRMLPMLKIAPPASASTTLPVLEACRLAKKLSGEDGSVRPRVSPKRTDAARRPKV
jgi:hypothetical protein